MKLEIFAERTPGKLSQGQLATGSVIGTLMGMGLKPKDSVEISFEQKGLKWCQNNGGPEEIIIPSFSMFCFAEDLLWLTKEGYEVTITSFEANI